MNVRYPLEAPASTDTIIVFPWNNREEKFDRNFYVPSMADYKATFDQINQFLEEADVFAKQRIRKVRATYFLFLVSIITLLTCVLIILIATSDPFGIKVGLMIAWILVTAAFCVFLSKYIRRRFKTMKDEIDRLNTTYSAIFEKVGLRWEFAIHYPGWMELRKEYKMEKEYLHSGLESTQTSVLEIRHEWDRQYESEYQYLKNSL